MGMAALMLFSCEKKNEVYNAEPMGAPATKGACDAEEQAIVDGLRDRMVVFSSVEDYLAKADELSGDMDVDYDALMAWKAANRCVLPGVEGELLFMESDRMFGDDLDGSIDWLLENGGSYVEYHTPDHEVFSADAGERYLEPVYSHLMDRFFLNEDRMFIVGNQVIKNVGDELLAVNVKEYKELLGINTVSEYEALHPAIMLADNYIPEHPNPNDANLAYGQSQYHESINGNFKMSCEPYVKNYTWVLYKAAITGFKMHNYEYSSAKKTWKNKKIKTEYSNSIFMGYYAGKLYCVLGGKNGSFNAASKKAYKRFYHQQYGFAPNTVPFINGYGIQMSNNKGCKISVAKPMVLTPDK